MKKQLTCIKLSGILVASYREVVCIVDNSRADYFRKRRENTKPFYVEVETKKMEQFEKKLDNKTKKEWLNEKIDEELKK